MEKVPFLRTLRSVALRIFHPSVHTMTPAGHKVPVDTSYKPPAIALSEHSHVSGKPGSNREADEAAQRAVVELERDIEEWEWASSISDGAFLLRARRAAARAR